MDAGSTDDTKVCPFCAETIKAGAIKCRYCGSSLTAVGEQGEAKAALLPASDPAPQSTPPPVDSTDPATPSSEEPVRAGSWTDPHTPPIGGFLVLLTLGLVLFPLRFAVSALGNYSPLFKPSGFGYSGWFTLWQFQRHSAYLVLLGLFLELATLSIWAVLIQAYFQRLESTRRLFFALIFVEILQTALTLSTDSKGGSTESPNLGAIVVWWMVWAIYLSTGKRPKTTFVRAGTVRWRWLAYLPGAGLLVFAWFAHAATAAAEATRAKVSPVELKTNDLLLGAAINDPTIASRMADLDGHPRTKSADPWSEFAKKGLLRESDDVLVRWASLMSAMLGRADEGTCAAKWTGRDVDKLGHLLDYLNSTEVDQWSEIIAAASLAELMEQPASVAPGPEDGTNVMAAIMSKLSPDDSARFSADVRKGQGPADREACWAVRTMFSRSSELDPRTRAVAARWMASF